MYALPSAAIDFYMDCAARARSYHALPFGKPGRRLKKSVRGEKFVYREVAVLSGDTRLRKLGPLGSQAAEEADGVFHAATWMPTALEHLRSAGFYTAARQLEEPLSNAFNLGLFAAGAVLIGPLAYLYWLNELGQRAAEHAPAAPDLDLALPGQMRLDDAQAAFLNACIKTKNSRLHVHFEAADYARYLKTRMRLPYQALLKRHCFMANLHYLTQGARPATALAGDYLIPVRLPAPGRIYWQKLYWSRLPDNPRADVERYEARMLGALLQAQLPHELVQARHALPVQWARQLAADPRLRNLFDGVAESPFLDSGLA